MNQGDPLAALQPLRHPEAIHWWPPAPGWWFLAGLFVLATIALVLWVVARRRATQYRRQGAQQLQTLLVEFERHNDRVRLISEMNALLKSVALRAYPRELVARCYGAEWVTFLNAQVSGAPPALAFEVDCFNAIYQGEAAALDVDQLTLATSHWIKHHRPAQ